MENIPRYIIRASFSQERMTYLPLESKVEYTFKDWKNLKTFDALEWLAAMCSHVPNRGEQMVRYYGHCSNVSRGRRIFPLTHNGGSPYTSRTYEASSYHLITSP